jgi:hypothetical protein
MTELIQSFAVPAAFAVPGGHTAPSLALPGYPQSALLNQAHAYWLDRRGAAEMPSWVAMNTRLFDVLRPHSILFDVEREPLDFRYAEIGSRIVAVSNADNTGRRISELPHQRPPSRVWEHFTGALDARAPVKGALPYVGRSRDIGGAFQIVMPLADDGRTVDRLLVCVDLSPAPALNRLA